MSDSFKEPNVSNLDAAYSPRWLGQSYAVDLNGDGYSDLVLLGATYPGDGNPVPQPGLVAFGNGDGSFAVAKEATFPVSQLTTIHPREAVFADFNRKRPRKSS